MTTEVAPPSAARALAILGSSSLITVLAGIASAKLAAELIGPSGFGLVALVQGISATVAALIELGLASAVVRAYAPETDVRPSLAALGSCARRIVLIAGGFAVVAAAILAPLLSKSILGDDRRPIEFLVAAVAGVPVALAVLENGLMIAAHRVKAVAKAAVYIAFVSPAVNAAWFITLGQDGVAPGALCSAVVVLAVTSSVRRRELHEEFGQLESSDVEHPRAGLTRPLLRDGVPVMASALAGAAAMLLLPIIVSDRLGRDGVGYYRAANVISLGYTAAVITVIGSDFLPRVSRVSSSPVEVSRLVLKQIRLLTSVLVPLLVVTSALLPLAVTILYRSDFAPTVSILEWQLVGDLFRVVGSVLATAVFARFGGTRRLITEILGLGALVALSTLGLYIDGPRGLGLGFLLTYAMYAAMLWVALGVSRAGREATRAAVWLVVAAAACALPPLAVHITDHERARWIGFAVAAVWLAPLAKRLKQRRTVPAPIDPIPGDESALRSESG